MDFAWALGKHKNQPPFLRKTVKNIWKSYIWTADKDVNESDPRSNVHYLGSSENKAWKGITFIHVFVRSSNIWLSYVLNRSSNIWLSYILNRLNGVPLREMAQGNVE